VPNAPAAVRAAGLKPPARFGTEVVARLLGVRTNHPAGEDSLELRPSDAATRAEAAFSAARVLALEDRGPEVVRDAASAFEVPDLTPWQTRVLRTAVSLIGYPCVWGGTSETAQAPFGSPVSGGFDCSGFVWRVYKLQQYAGAGQLAQVDHTAIYLGGGWLIHSSGYGVALAPLTGWYASRFAWARRPLAEARIA
jgi:cell wall-associated NlpC family hydrolase